MSFGLGPVLNSALLPLRQHGRLPQTLNFFVTSRCNARCEFCLYWDQITNPVAKRLELRPDEVDRIAQRYGPLHYLALSGGEPFVREDLPDLVQPFVDRCGTAVVDVPSNFYYTEHMVSAIEPLARRNPSVVFEVQLSLDHIGELHDRSRKVEGLYARAVETFRRLAEVRRAHPNLRLKISIVYLPCNRDDLEAIVDRALRDFDCDRINLSFPQRTLPPGAPPPELPDEVARYDVAAEKLTRGLRSRRGGDLHTLAMRSVKAVYRDLLRQAADGSRRVGSYCAAGRHIVVLNEKGDVFPCEPLWQPVGNVRDHDYDVGAVLRGAANAAFGEQHLGEGKCNCTWSCAMHTYVSVTPGMLPRVGLEASRIALRELLGRTRP